LKKLLCFSIISLLILSISGIGRAAAQDQTKTPIQHVVYVMMENHSFDNFFGVYPTDNRNLSSSAIQTTLTVPVNLLSNASLSAQLSAVPKGTFNTPNPVEDVYPKDFDGGKMDGFLANSGPQSMTYFTDSQIAIEWNWAEEYGLGDNYFSSALSETTPNRLYSLAGASSVSSNYGPPPYMNASQTIFSQLGGAGVTWSYFAPPGEYSYDSYPLNYFQGMDAYQSNLQGWSQFSSDLNQKSLPAVSIVSSLGYLDVDQHPSDNVTYGEEWLLGIVNQVMQSPYWNSTVIFINYDEGGGYYDQVPPPMLDGVQLGFRVPLIVISPYAKENYVSHTILNHASILAFIEYNWNLPPLNSFVGDSNIPLDFFDFAQSPRLPIVLTNSSAFPYAIQVPFDKLLYNRTGSSAINLLGTSGSTAGLTTATNSQYQSFLNFFSTETGQIILGIVVAVVLISVVGYALRSSMKRRKYYGYHP
jgi:phospholipase C